MAAIRRQTVEQALPMILSDPIRHRAVAPSPAPRTHTHTLKYPPTASQRAQGPPPPPACLARLPWPPTNQPVPQPGHYTSAVGRPPAPAPLRQSCFALAPAHSVSRPCWAFARQPGVSSLATPSRLAHRSEGRTCEHYVSCARTHNRSDRLATTEPAHTHGAQQRRTPREQTVQQGHRTGRKAGDIAPGT